MANYYRFVLTPTHTLPSTVVWEDSRLYTVFTPDVRDSTNPLSFWDNLGEDIYTFEDGEPI